MSHFFGPTWMAKDGSFVVGHNAVPYPVAGTIPWLRLPGQVTGAGPYGDKLEKTTYIQRLHTTGGVAPAAATCNATTAGTQAEVALHRRLPVLSRQVAAVSEASGGLHSLPDP